MPYTVFVAHSWKLLTDHVPNGDGLFAYGLLRRMAERGHTLHVACRAVDLREPVPPGLVLHQLTTDSGELSVRGRLRYMRRLRALYERLAATEDLHLVHQPNPVDVGVTLALPATAPPVVLGPYWADWPLDAEPTGRLDRVRLRAEQGGRRLLRARQQRRAAAVLLTTEAARVKVDDGSLHLQVALVPPGVEPAEFPALAQRPAGRAPTVLFLANLRAHKGIFTLLDAFERVVVEVPDARLVIAGSGPDELAVRQRVARSGAASRIELIGAVPRTGVPATMARADVFCQPGHGEPFGWSAVEAMACGLPVVVTSAGGLGVVVPDGAGRKVPPRDPTALGAALVELLTTPALRTIMGEAGRREVARTYAWDRVIDRLEGVYETVARLPGPRRPSAGF